MTEAFYKLEPDYDQHGWNIEHVTALFESDNTLVGMQRRGWEELP
jgi:hypothetical protein